MEPVTVAARCLHFALLIGLLACTPTPTPTDDVTTTAAQTTNKNTATQLPTTQTVTQPPTKTATEPPAKTATATQPPTTQTGTQPPTKTATEPPAKTATATKPPTSTEVSTAASTKTDAKTTAGGKKTTATADGKTPASTKSPTNTQKGATKAATTQSTNKPSTKKNSATTPQGLSCFDCFASMKNDTKCIVDQIKNNHNTNVCKANEACWTTMYSMNGIFTNITRECSSEICSTDGKEMCEKEEQKNLEKCTHCCSKSFCNEKKPGSASILGPSITIIVATICVLFSI